MHSRLPFWTLVLVIILSGSTGASALGTCPDDSDELCLQGAASPAYTSDSNRCVPNVTAQFDALKDHGEIMGFLDGGSRIGYPSLDADKQHWQGIQRLAFPPDHRILMALSSSHNSGGHYAIVSLGTRGVGGISGRRFGGNRMSDATQDWNVKPQANDTIIQKGKTILPDTFTHPSGIQTLGQFLAIPLEVIGGGGPPGRTELFDAGLAIDFGVTQCHSTGTTDGCIRRRWTFGHSQPGDGAVALAKLDDGRYVMINALARDIKILEINVSQLNDGSPLPISDPQVFGAWNSRGGQFSALFDMSTLPGWHPYQNLQLVTECGNGHLYLVGVGREGSEDRADLYRLNLATTRAVNSELEPIISTSSITATFNPIRSKHFWCRYEGSPRQCDFDAAGGIYVDPFGTLILYATVHDDSGPKPGVTRFVEFSPNDPVDLPDTPGTELCDSASNMWVELSNQPLTTGNLPPVGAERFFIEYQNEARNDARFATAYSFNDQARAIRYCLPPGFRYKLCSNALFGGTCQFFCGDAAGGCSGPISAGQIRGMNFAKATASSGCFINTDTPNCLP